MEFHPAPVARDIIDRMTAASKAAGFDPRIAAMITLAIMTGDAEVRGDDAVRMHRKAFNSGLKLGVEVGQVDVLMSDELLEFFPEIERDVLDVITPIRRELMRHRCDGFAVWAEVIRELGAWLFSSGLEVQEIVDASGVLGASYASELHNERPPHQ
jgi:hypothetical protein